MASKRKHVTLTLEKRQQFCISWSLDVHSCLRQNAANVGKSTIFNIKKEILRYVLPSEKGPEISDVEDAV